MTMIVPQKPKLNTVTYYIHNRWIRVMVKMKVAKKKGLENHR